MNENETPLSIIEEDYDLIRVILDASYRNINKVAISKGKKSYTYAQLKDAIEAVAFNLQKEGLKQGDRFFFSVSPDIDGIILALGVVAAGGVIVFADPGTSPELFKARTQLCSPRYTAAESILYFASTKIAAPLVKKKKITLPDYRNMGVEQYFYAGPWLPGVPKGAKNVSRLFKRSRETVLPQTDPSQESIIVFTSGTTNRPKSVRHSRNSIGSGLYRFAKDCFGHDGSSVITDHFNVGIAALAIGAHWIIPENPPAKDASKWVDELMVPRPSDSFTFLVPADVTLMLDEIESRNLKPDALKLGTIVMGAAPVLPSLIRRVNRILPGTHMLSVYGMTEILPISIVDGKDKLGYPEGDLAGKLQPGVNARIDNPDESGAGELVLSGPGLMLGYLGEENSVEHHTGDMAKFDEQGNLVLLGRIKDMLIRSNKNIYPGLYEPGISAIEGVETCAIVGIPDVYGEDVVVLVLVPEDKTVDEKEFRKRIAPELITALDGDAQPDVILVRPELPLFGRSNKPDRIALREAVSKDFSVKNILAAHDKG